MIGLEPGAYYWAVARQPEAQPVVVQVSTVFGEDREYWTLALVGSDQHKMPEEFSILARIEECQATMSRSTAKAALKGSNAVSLLDSGSASPQH